MNKFRFILEKLQQLDKIPVYLLGESFKLVERNYGTDFGNKEWATKKNPLDNSENIKVTFFHTPDGNYILIVDSKGGVKFNSIKDVDSLDKFDYEDWFKFFKYERTNIGSVNVLLGIILSILQRSTSDLNRKEFTFTGADIKLQKTYEFFVKNIKVNSYLNTLSIDAKVVDDHIEIKFN